MAFKNNPRQVTMAQATESLSHSAQAKLRAAERIKAGAVGADGPHVIHVVPASFVSKKATKFGPVGSIVAGCKVGGQFLTPDHVDALLEALGVTSVDETRYLALFS